MFNDRFIEAVGWLRSLVAQSKKWAAAMPTDDPDADFECIKECEWLSERLQAGIDATADPGPPPASDGSFAEIPF